MDSLTVLTHRYRALGLRFFGLGPNLFPTNGIKQLQSLLQKNTTWANERSKKNLKTMIKNSSVVVSLWSGKKLVGFGRATTDGIYRAVLWDIVVDNDIQGTGLGKNILNALLNHNDIKKVEKVYLMTTKKTDFYLHNGFGLVTNQSLLKLN